MRTAGLLITVVAAAVGAAPAAASDAVVVKLDPAERAGVHARADVEPAGRVPGLTGIEVVRPEDGDRARALAELRADPAVAWAEPDRKRHGFVDAYLDDQWGLENIGQRVWEFRGTADADIDADQAWDVSEGEGMTIGVVDSGITANHPDFAGKLLPGWDFLDNDAEPVDEDGHGTHVAGIAAARRGAGEVVGVAPDARVLPVQALDENGDGTASGVAAALTYAASHGARIVNLSLGALGASSVERAAIRKYPGTLFVVAAGNAGRDAGGTQDYDGTFPCAYPEPNILCVGASDQFDAPASFSNYGSIAVDLFAPGVDIVSTWKLESSWWEDAHPSSPLGYEVLSGTSMATPYAAGVAALVAAEHPTWSPTWVKRALMETVDAKPGLEGRSVTGGRLDAADAVNWEPPAGEEDPGPPPTPEPEPDPDPGPDPGPPATTGTPNPTPQPPPAPTPQPGPEPIVRPAISGLHVVGRPRACRRSCGSSSAALAFRASVAGKVRLTAYRRIGRRYKRVGARTVTVRAGEQRIRLGRKLAGATLRSGRWRVTLGTARVSFRVR